MSNQICDQADRTQRTKASREPKSPPANYPWGVKTWLKRNEIWWEYGLCPRTIHRLEQRGLLAASKIVRHCIYKRADVEACLEQAKWSAQDSSGASSAKRRGKHKF